MLHAAPQAKEPDFKSRTEHPMFTRMPDLRIKTCKAVEQQ